MNLGPAASLAPLPADEPVPLGQGDRESTVGLERREGVQGELDKILVPAASTS